MPVTISCSRKLVNVISNPAKLSDHFDQFFFRGRFQKQSVQQVADINLFGNTGFSGKLIKLVSNL